MRPVGVSCFRNTYDNQPDEHVWSWDDLVQRLTTVPVVQDRGEVGLWSPCSYGDSKRRASENVATVHALTLDIDDCGPDTPDKAWWLFRGWARVLHTSWRHTWEAPRFRLVLPLAEPVPAELWPDCWAWMVRHLPAWLSPDPACKDPARMFWLPAQPDTDDSRQFCHVEPGPYIGCPVDKVRGEVRARRQKTEAERKRRLQRMRRQATPDTAASEVRRRLREDPDARLALAQALGASVQGVGSKQRAQGYTCPACARASVWWPIMPTKSGVARCHHINSCGWWSHLDQLRGL